MCLDGPVISAARSSTKRVGFTLGKSVTAASTARIMMSLISAVAKPDPAVMPRPARIECDTTPPMRITLSNW